MRHLDITGTSEDAQAGALKNISATLESLGDMRAEVRRRVERSFAAELAAWESGQEVIAIALLTPKKGRYADVLDLALMRVSEQMIGGELALRFLAGLPVADSMVFVVA